jgi:hypothetical protein
VRRLSNVPAGFVSSTQCLGPPARFNPTTFNQSNPKTMNYNRQVFNRPKGGLKEGYDSQTGIPSDCSLGARCVQRLDDSQIHANRITFRISLRSSSLQEPRDPLLKVVF